MIEPAEKVSGRRPRKPVC